MVSEVTMVQVARAAGVSPMTVSYTFNKPSRVAHSTRERVLETARQLGYHGPNASASALRTGKSRQLGVVLGEYLTYAFEDPQATSFLAGVARECVTRGYGLSLIPVSGTDDSDRLASVDVSGYVVWTAAEDNPILDGLAVLGRPVAVNGGPARDGWGLVALDDAAAAEKVGDVALRGARNPVIISLPARYNRIPRITENALIDQISFPVTRSRLQGFAQAIENAGLKWENVPVAFLSRNDRNEALDFTQQLIKRYPDTDAVIAMSDQIAFGTLDALRLSDLIAGEDVAVTGWDDGPAAQAAGLTTVTQSLLEQGAQCAQMVLDASAPTLRQRIAASWKVTERTSTRQSPKEVEHKDSGY